MQLHDPGLYRHSLRVGKLAADFYDFCGMDFGSGWDLIEGGLLHDLGKICLPASLLTKPRELNEAEKRMVALHPKIGAEMLEAQQYSSKRVINIVRRHHERLDGSGYPDGWRTRRTAKPVRIIAVCDALCAMTEERPYEDAWPMREALERLKSMPDQYDQEPLEVLQKMFQKRGTCIQIYEVLHASRRQSSRKSSCVLRPRSAFYAPRRKVVSELGDVPSWH